MLIEFGGLPGTGKSTLAAHLADRTGAVLLRIDVIDAAMRRVGLIADQTGVAAYGVAHDLAAAHLKRGFTVIVDAVNPVEEARAGWRALAEVEGARHLVIETGCEDPAEHRRRATARDNDIADWVYPSWEEIGQRRREYQPRHDERLVLDTTRPVGELHEEIDRYLTATDHR